MTDRLKLPESRLASFAAWCQQNRLVEREMAAQICERLANMYATEDEPQALFEAARRIREQPIPGQAEGT